MQAVLPLFCKAVVVLSEEFGTPSEPPPSAPGLLVTGRASGDLVVVSSGLSESGVTVVSVIRKAADLATGFVLQLLDAEAARASACFLLLVTSLLKTNKSLVK